jgi:hypothetical protein
MTNSRTEKDIRSDIARLQRELRQVRRASRPSQRSRAKAVRTLIARKDGHRQHYYVKRTKAWRRSHERKGKAWSRKASAPSKKAIAVSEAPLEKWRVQVTTVDYNEVAAGKTGKKLRHISTASVTVKCPKGTPEEEIRQEALDILTERAGLEADPKIRLGIRRLLDTPEALIVGMERVT